MSVRGKSFVIQDEVQANDTGQKTQNPPVFAPRPKHHFNETWLWGHRSWSLFEGYWAGRRGCWYRLRVIWQTSLEGSVRGSAVAGSGPVRSEDPECSLWHAARSPSYSRSCSVVNSARAPSACCSSHSCCTRDWAGRPRSSCSIKCRDYAPKNTRRVSLWTSPDWLPS